MAPGEGAPETIYCLFCDAPAAALVSVVNGNDEVSSLLLCAAHWDEASEAGDTLDAWSIKEVRTWPRDRLVAIGAVPEQE